MAYQKDGDRLCTKAHSNEVRSNGVKWNEGKFRLDVGKIFFMSRMVRCWNCLLREVANAPSLEVFEVMLGVALSNLI